jgi:leucyl/phenylalanyl-tRNA--protein transferase
VLVGGLYGIAIGQAFFGESMFAHRPDASKVAFATFVRELANWGCELIDCQQETDHLKRFGAESWSRTRFLDALARAIAKPSRVGGWTFECGPWDGRTDGWPFVTAPHQPRRGDAKGT